MTIRFEKNRGIHEELSLSQFTFSPFRPFRSFSPFGLFRSFSPFSPLRSFSPYRFPISLAPWRSHSRLHPHFYQPFNITLHIHLH